MAHTAIRLNFSTFSANGGFFEYPSLADFPATGYSGVIYLAADTKKIYIWTGASYEEISQSDVTSVNTQTGDVVLTKSDIGLDQVDNTSDADKPISNAVQTELTAIDGRLDNLEEINSVKKIHVFEDNIQIYADGRPGVKDPSTNIYSNGLVRDGWYFKNSLAGQKINWYFFDGTTQGTITLANFSAYAVMTFDAITAYPILAFYTFPTGVGDVIPGFAHSRVVYANPLVPVAVAGVKYLVYFGDEPAAHPELPRIKLTKSTISSAGDQNPAEVVLTASFGSDSGEPVNEVQFLVETLGVNSPTVKQEMGLRIKSAIQSDLSSHITNLNNPHVVTKTQVGLSNVDNTSDANKPISSATQTALNAKEDTSNKSIDGTLAANSDTLYPSQKAVKTYVDASTSSLQNDLDASVYYHELHVNYDYTGAVVDGSPYNPFKTVQAAVNAAQLQNIGGNTAILIHLKNDITMVEDIVVNNAVSNLYIMPAVRNNTNSGPFKIIGSLTITGTQTNRVRVQDIEFAPTTGYALVISGTNGRHLFQNCAFVNGSIPGQAGTGVNLTGTYRNFIEFIDCTIEGTLNIAGTPIAGTTVTMYRSRLTYANVIVNSANVAVGMYDTYSIYGLTHTAGALSLVGLWGITGFFNSTASISATNFLSLSNLSLQKYDLTFVPLNKTGTCLYQLINVHRGETADVLTGTRTVYGPTATDAGYKMGVSGNWSPAVSNVAGALDQLAANKISTSQKGVANGVASLDGTGKVPSAQLPAYVDDVLEFANLAAFPVTGSTGIIYVALDTNKCYRWSGSTYIEISPAPVTSVNGQTNAVSLDALDIPFTPTTTITSTNVQDAIEEVEASAAASTAAIFEDTKEPTGFINRTDSTISFVDGTRIFTIAPVATSFSFYIKGEKFTKTTAQSITIPNLTGTHYIYFNTSGALETTQVPSADLFQIDAIIAIVYWNNETNLSTLFGEERHGITMDGVTHSYLHTILGARYLSGLALQNFTIGSGNSNADAQFTSDEGSIRDEDILHTIPAQTQIPILYRQGQYWRKKVADAYPLIYSGSAGYTGANGRPAYNQYTGGAWQLTQMSNTNFILVHFFGTNDVNNKVIGVVGTQQYNNITAARTGANSEISLLSDLPFTEFVPIGSVIFQSNNYSNAVKARVVQTDLGQNYVDFRGTQVYTPAGQASDHGLLSGLVDDDHIQYHNDARGDIRYYTKAEIDSLIGDVFPTGSISETTYVMSNSQALPDDVDAFLFANASVRAFNATVTVVVNATTSLYELFEINGVQKGSDWEITIQSTGDVSGVSFSITSAGQIQYTSTNYAGFVSGAIKFKATTSNV